MVAAVAEPSVGLELDPEIAESSRKRLRRFDNVEIVTGNALEHLPPDGTVFWIFNSFDEGVVRRFLAKVKEVSTRRQQIRILYYNPVFMHVFADDAECSVEVKDYAKGFGLATVSFRMKVDKSSGKET